MKKIRDRFPGPGTYEAAPLKVGHMKKILGGKLDEEAHDDNVPGPGAYEKKSTLLADAPGFVIKPHQSQARQRFDKSNRPLIQEPIAPNKYNPVHVTHVSKTVTIGTSQRQSDNTHIYKPAPNKYYIPGDFDFKDPNNREETTGKDPKFHFGMNSKTRDKNLDMPGPGEYDMNVYPSN